MAVWFAPPPIQLPANVESPLQTASKSVPPTVSGEKMEIPKIGIGKKDKINKWLGADTSAIEELKNKVSTFTQKVKRNPSLTDLMIMLAIGFGTVGFGHFTAKYLSTFFNNFVASIESQTWRNVFSFLGSSFFWLISISTIMAVILSLNLLKKGFFLLFE